MHHMLDSGTATVTMKEIESASRLFDGLHGVKVRNMSIETCFGKPMTEKVKSKGTKGSLKGGDLKKLSKTAKIKISGKAGGNKFNTKAKGKKSKKKKNTVK